MALICPFKMNNLYYAYLFDENGDWAYHFTPGLYNGAGSPITRFGSGGITLPTAVSIASSPARTTTLTPTYANIGTTKPTFNTANGALTLDFECLWESQGAGIGPYNPWGDDGGGLPVYQYPITGAASYILESGVIYRNIANLSIHCHQTFCQLWHNDVNECGLKALAGIGMPPESGRAPLVSQIEHIHNSHLHASDHDCASTGFDIDTTSSCGADASVGGDAPAAMALVTEYVAGEDRDNNTYLYGKDFKITNDATRPKMLKSLEEDIDWPNPTNEITWSVYLNGGSPYSRG